MGNLHEISETNRQRAQAPLIRQQVDRIVSSELFAKADRLCQFLRFIVETSLREGTDQLKETRIGVHVYHRSAGYDPKAEPIVRTEARRLRLKLEEYYAGPGRQDRVRITVPTGGYAPQFEIRPEDDLPQLAMVVPEPAVLHQAAPSKFRMAWVCLALLSGILVGVLGYRFAYHHTPSVAPHAVPITRYQGFEFQPSLSPDSKQVAFVWNGTDSNYNLYVKDLGSSAPRRLTSSPEQDLHPTWAPDCLSPRACRWSKADFYCSCFRR